MYSLIFMHYLQKNITIHNIGLFGMFEKYNLILVTRGRCNMSDKNLLKLQVLLMSN